MDQKVKAYISKQPVNRREILSRLHENILNDNTVTEEIGLMMGKEMVIYNAYGMMKYALASVEPYVVACFANVYVARDLREI